MLANLILVRHGESLWNRDHRFTGWADVGLTDTGIAQVKDSAAAIQAAKLEFDVAFSSVLGRCIQSQWLLLEALECVWIPQVLDWRLNERHYGALTGMLKLNSY
jgi:2,3-bisphosphoglycerate-dependent phosphoglycerate mutase